MEKIYDDEGNLIQVLLSKEEQLELARENNRRMKEYKSKERK